jgi:hypothetical protein
MNPDTSTALQLLSVFASKSNHIDTSRSAGHLVPNRLSPNSDRDSRSRYESLLRPMNHGRYRYVPPESDPTKYEHESPHIAPPRDMPNQRHVPAW